MPMVMRPFMTRNAADGQDRDRVQSSQKRRHRAQTIARRREVLFGIDDFRVVAGPAREEVCSVPIDFRFR